MLPPTGTGALVVCYDQWSETRPLREPLSAPTPRHVAAWWTAQGLSLYPEGARSSLSPAVLGTEKAPLPDGLYGSGAFAVYGDALSVAPLRVDKPESFPAR